MYFATILVLRACDESIRGHRRIESSLMRAKLIIRPLRSVCSTLTQVHSLLFYLYSLVNLFIDNIF